MSIVVSRVRFAPVVAAGTVVVCLASVVHGPSAIAEPPPPPPVIVIDDGDGWSFDFGGNSPGVVPVNPKPPTTTEPVWDEAPVCITSTLIAAPADPAWAGHTAAEGRVVQDICPSSVPPMGAPYFLAFDAPAPPNAGLLAVEAMNSISFPTPVPRMGPDRMDQLAVNRWLYLWVADPGVLSASVTVPGLTVTASGSLTSSTWSMGELKDPAFSGRVDPFTCAGGGWEPVGAVAWSVAGPADSSCAYWYRLRSLPDRTGGSATWPVTVSTTWSVVWTASNGMTGTATRTQVSAVLDVSVGEWRTVAVADDWAGSETEGGR